MIYTIAGDCGRTREEAESKYIAAGVIIPGDCLMVRTHEGEPLYIVVARKMAPNAADEGWESVMRYTEFIPPNEPIDA